MKTAHTAHFLVLFACLLTSAAVAATYQNPNPEVFLEEPYTGFMMNNDTGINNTHSPKAAWPELIGSDCEEAKDAILSEFPDLQVVVVPEGSFVTMDYREDRVRVFCSKKGKVVREPRRG